MELRGRLAAAAAIGDRVAVNNKEAYGLLLCVRLPSGRFDDSAHRLLSQMPPHMKLAQSEDPQTLSLPYDLLISHEQARADFEAFQLGKVAAPGDLDESVCNAHLMLASRGYQGTQARQAYWREVLADLAGQWVRVTVDPQRYSFRGTGLGGLPVQRVGTRLVLRAIEPLE
jgi:hypothetical protein